jgi:regulator of protease activity HflC (stomatin/prohibitin superfamily)
VVVLGFFVLLFWRLIFVVIPPGHAGVRYDLFLGTRLGPIAREGLNLKFPWNRIYLYDLRLQTLPQKVFALSREGMSVDVEIVVLFRPDPAGLPRLHTEIGPEYAHLTVVPLSIGAVRHFISQHNSHKLYTADAGALQVQIMNTTRAELARHHLIMQDVVLKRLILPSQLLAAIEEKLAQEQRADSYKFRLAAEASETERLRIKGVGLQHYYATVGGALTPPLLTWRGIEATTELAQSENSKVVIVGSGKDQLPLILGRDLSLQGESKTPSAPATGRR